MSDHIERAMNAIASININNEIIQVLHSDLERISEASIFRSHCPKCGLGTLMVNRNDDGSISEYDRCLLCGQVFQYLDIEKFIK